MSLWVIRLLLYRRADRSREPKRQPVAIRSRGVIDFSGIRANQMDPPATWLHRFQILRRRERRYGARVERRPIIPDHRDKGVALPAQLDVDPGPLGGCRSVVDQIVDRLLQAQSYRVGKLSGDCQRPLLQVKPFAE